jgi:uncharacterized membrane protein YhaH (DUF805 family)
LRLALADLWRLEGTVGRGTYALIGCALFAVKHNLDRFVATALFGRPWNIFSYLRGPQQGVESTAHAAAFYATMLVLALPFIWTGIALTLRRLRDAGWPAGLLLLFFVPVLNLPFFLLLSLVPSRGDASRRGAAMPLLARLVPETLVGSAAVAVLVTAVLSTPLVALSITVFRQYGAGLFVGLPFALGLVAALLFGYHEPRSWLGCFCVATIATLLLSVFLLALALEGVICLIMAGPIMVALATLGATLGYFLQRRGLPPEAATTVALGALLVVPFLMGAEGAAGLAAPLYEVQSAVDVAAPPEVVWRSVVSFSDLPAPSDWLFRAGIAYPVRATIEGRGRGAVRRCIFNTGPFIEPIDVWDEPHLLRFDVVSLPPPMQEWTPYRHVHPPHLDGFLTAERGEFRLEALPAGGTHLEGRTWYRHHMWPAGYWRLWSDAIIHRIHMRVLRHIQAEAEAD